MAAAYRLQTPSGAPGAIALIELTGTERELDASESARRRAGAAALDAVLRARRSRVAGSG